MNLGQTALLPHLQWPLAESGGNKSVTLNQQETERGYEISHSWFLCLFSRELHKC